MIAGGQGSEIWLSCLGPTAPKHSRKSSHSRTTGPRSSEKTHKTNIFIENKASNEDKSSNYGLRGSQDGGQTLHPFAIFLSVIWKNAPWTEVSHIVPERFSCTFKGDIWSFCSTCSTNRSVACHNVSNYYTQLQWILRKKGEIGRKILRYRFFCVFKASDFPSC